MEWRAEHNLVPSAIAKCSWKESRNRSNPKLARSRELVRKRKKSLKEKNPEIKEEKQLEKKLQIESLLIREKDGSDSNKLNYQKLNIRKGRIRSGIRKIPIARWKLNFFEKCKK